MKYAGGGGEVERVIESSGGAGNDTRLVMMNVMITGERCTDEWCSVVVKVGVRDWG